MAYHPKDHYFNKAKQENYPARSVYKLEEIDRRYKLIPAGARVLDLGSAPGSWLKYAAQRVGGHGLAVGIDIKPVTIPLSPQTHSLKADIFTIKPEDLQTFTPAFDVVLSDMAPATTGVRLADEQNSLALAGRALELAEALLKPGGKLLVKLFEGEDSQVLINKFKSTFAQVQIIRPQATRKNSREIFILGLDYSPVSHPPPRAL